MSLFAKITKRGLSENDIGLGVTPVFAEFTRFNRGTRTKEEIVSALTLTEEEWSEALEIFAKVNSVSRQGRLLNDIERLAILLEWGRDSTKLDFGVSSWADLLAEIDAWIATGAYSG